jgi:predicted Zn-dependent protease
MGQVRDAQTAVYAGAAHSKRISRQRRAENDADRYGVRELNLFSLQENKK